MTTIDQEIAKLQQIDYDIRNLLDIITKSFECGEYVTAAINCRHLEDGLAQANVLSHKLSNLEN